MYYYFAKTILLVLLSFLVTASAPAAQDKTGNGQITILMNEGVLIQSGETSILIDAFTDKEAALYKQMLRGNPPFSSIQLALVSHPHSEHFIPSVAGAFLKNHPETILISSSNIIKPLKDELAGSWSIIRQLKEVRTDKGRMTSHTVSGIRVDFIPFRHEASMFYPEQVMVHIIHIGGRKILLMGDAEMTPGNWEPYDLKSQDIDIAIVPFWLFKEAVTKNIIREHIAPEKIVVAQNLTSRLRKEAAKHSNLFSDVVFLNESMASTGF